MFCTKCRCELPDDADFCAACGADLRSFKGHTPPPVTAPPGTPATPFQSIGVQETVLDTGVPTLEPGAEVDDRYEILDVLGSGGMGTVYRVHDRNLDEECALKIMNPLLLSNEKALGRFVQEARVSRKLTHANIVRVYHLGEWNGLRYLTMELMRGRTLRTWMEQIEAEGRLCPVGLAVDIVAQLLDALEYAHQRMIHRDIKPENVFLVGSEPVFRVKLLDFGIARGFERERLTQTRSSLGTPFYMAPEQRKSAGEVDARADLYAVGVVLYELLTNAMPTGAFGKPSEERPELGPEWDTFVFAAMDRLPDNRPASAAEMRSRLEQVCARSAGGPATPAEATPRRPPEASAPTPVATPAAAKPPAPTPSICANPACRRALRPGVSFCTFCGRSVR
jgi:serine/threonine protein kinase